MTNQEYVNKIRQNLLNGRSTFSFKKDGEHHLFLRVNVGQGELLYRKVLKKTPTFEQITALASYKDFIIITPGRKMYGPPSLAKDTDISSYGEGPEDVFGELVNTLIPELYATVPLVHPDDEYLLQQIEQQALRWAREIALKREPASNVYKKLLNYYYKDIEYCLLGEKSPEEALRQGFSKTNDKLFYKAVLERAKELLRDPNFLSKKEQQLADAISRVSTDYIAFYFDDQNESTQGDFFSKKYILDALISSPVYPQIYPANKLATFAYTIKDENGDVVWSSNPKEQVVYTNMGRIPLVDYLEIQADKYGYNSYEALYNDGMRIDGYEDVSPDVFLTEQKNSL